MKIYVPTVGRVAQQTTADALIAAGVDFTLVVRPGEHGDLEKKYPVTVCDCTRINTKRDMIMQMGTGKLVMLDDDLRFYKRTDSNLFHLTTPQQLRELIDDVERTLDAFAHGGVAERAFGNARARGVSVNKRYIRVLAYNRTKMPDPPPKYRTVTASDLDVALQLIKAGLPSFLLGDWAQTDRSFNDAGGCSLWRTPDVLLEGHRQLVALHPGVVEIAPTEKDPAHLKINWKAAAKMGGCDFNMKGA